MPLKMRARASAKPKPSVFVIHSGPMNWGMALNLRVGRRSIYFDECAFFKTALIIYTYFYWNIVKRVVNMLFSKCHRAIFYQLSENGVIFLSNFNKQTWCKAHTHTLNIRERPHNRTNNVFTKLCPTCVCNSIRLWSVTHMHSLYFQCARLYTWDGCVWCSRCRYNSSAFHPVLVNKNTQSG